MKHLLKSTVGLCDHSLICHNKDYIVLDMFAPKSCSKSEWEVICKDSLIFSNEERILYSRVNTLYLQERNIISSNSNLGIVVLTETQHLYLCDFVPIVEGLAKHWFYLIANDIYQYSDATNPREIFVKSVKVQESRDSYAVFP